MKRFLTKKQKNNGETNNIGVEKLLLTLFIITFTIMLVAQIGLTSPEIRSFLTAEEEMQGKPLGIEEYLYDEGEIGIKLIKNDGDNALKVMVNGEVTEAFTSSYISLKVKNGDVIEIDGSNSEYEALVQVVSKSENIDDECINKSVKIQGNVMKLVNVKFK